MAKNEGSLMIICANNKLEYERNREISKGYNAFSSYKGKTKRHKGNRFLSFRYRWQSGEQHFLIHIGRIKTK